MVLSDRYERARLKPLRDIGQLIDFFHDDRRRLANASAFLPQVDYVRNDADTVGVDALFAMDPATREPLGLTAWLGCGPLPRVNVSARLPVTLSALAKRKLADLYAADFELFDRALAQSQARAIELGL